jgi:hypothetical protein
MMDPLPKALIGSSLSDASSAEAARDADEGNIDVVVDLRELAQSYDFRASSIIVSRIQ